MEFRKLIRFGKSSYVISLPKKWVEKNKLEKGNTISLEFKGKDILVSPKTESKEFFAKIKIDFRDYPLITHRALSALYKAGYDDIEVFFHKFTF